MNFFQSLTSLKTYSKLSFITPITIFILMIFGSYVKALGAGLACPDWPLCHDQLIPVHFVGDPALWVYMEYIHRLIALVVVFLVISIVLCAYVYRQISPRLFRLTILIAILLTIQIILGGLTIDTHLNAIVVTTHFTDATIIFGLSIVHGFLMSNDLATSKVEQAITSLKPYKEDSKTTHIEVH